MTTVETHHAAICDAVAAATSSDAVAKTSDTAATATNHFDYDVHAQKRAVSLLITSLRNDAAAAWLQALEDTMEPSLPPSLPQPLPPPTVLLPTASPQPHKQRTRTPSPPLDSAAAVARGRRRASELERELPSRAEAIG